MGAEEQERERLAAESLEIFKLHADFCRVFCTASRLQIMWTLADGERTVSQLAEHIGITLQNTSQHLRIMRDRGAVESRRDGKTVWYRVGNPKFLMGARLIREGLLEHLAERGRFGEQ